MLGARAIPNGAEQRRDIARVHGDPPVVTPVEPLRVDLVCLQGIRNDLLGL